MKAGLKAFKRAAGLASEPSTCNSIVLVDGEAYEDAQEAILHRDAHDEGGLGFTDKELLTRQREAVVEVVKQLGSNLLTGNFDLLKMSLPVKLFEPRSYLQKLADTWVYPRFLQLAAEAEDPAERMKWVVTWFVAGLHHAFERWAKPFNPILGETWQATLSDGSQIFLEQISHHPPVSAFELCGPNGSYVFSGLSQPVVSFGVKNQTVKTVAKGYRAVAFPDGTKISIHYPAYYLKGLLYTSMPRAEIGGTAEFDDELNGLHASITFGKVEGSRNPVLTRSDAFSGTLYEDIGSVAGALKQQQANKGPARRTSKGSVASLSGMVPRSLTLRSKSAPAIDEAGLQTPVASCTGNWLSHLDWASERYWTLGEEAPDTWQPDPNPLPSDLRYREDLVLLQRNDIKLGQQAKEMLEHRQRADVKLRKQGNSEG